MVNFEFGYIPTLFFERFMNIFLDEVSRLISFLSLNPSIVEIHTRLLLDFLTPFHIKDLTVYSVSNSPSVGSIRLDNLSSGLGEPNNQNTQFKQLSTEFGVESLINEGSKHQLVFNREQNSCVSTISNGRISLGLFQADFSKPINGNEIAKLSIFLKLSSLTLFPKIKSFQNSSHPVDNDSNRLTPRQRQVVKGFVEGKTNHEISLELGFSISTIRHETMSIFKSLGVSDRKEAAKIAQEQVLI